MRKLSSHSLKQERSDKSDQYFIPKIVSKVCILW